MGIDCLWRHSPLTPDEVSFMISLGAKDFAETCQKNWCLPRIPPPSLPKIVAADFEPEDSKEHDG
jgi:hypothetical protein